MTLDESTKRNEVLRNQLSSQDEKMKSLKQKLAEFEAKLTNLTSTKPVVDERSVSVPVKSKDKIYIHPLNRNKKEKAYFDKLDKGKNFNVDADVFKPVSKPSIRVHKKSIFVSTCHFCGVVGHIRPFVLCVCAQMKYFLHNVKANMLWLIYGERAKQVLDFKEPKKTKFYLKDG